MSQTPIEPREPVEVKENFGEYDVDAPEDAQPDFDAEETDEADEVFDDEQEGDV